MCCAGLAWFFADDRVTNTAFPKCMPEDARSVWLGLWVRKCGAIYSISQDLVLCQKHGLSIPVFLLRDK
jgi:hypothetical protein